MTDVPTAPRARTARRAAADPAPGPSSGDAAPAQAAAVVRRPARPAPPPSGFERLVVPPDTGGPRVRLGFLWFFLALAAVTSGRWWTAALTAAVAAAAGYQVARAWAMARAVEELDDDRPVPQGTGRLAALGSAVLAGSVPMAAGYGTGAAGAALLVVALVAGAVMAIGSVSSGAEVAIASVLPAVAASSIVLALQVDLWVALFLVLAVSLYDAGNFALGAEATGRWEGPVGGVLGALAVTFTMATIQVPPLDRVQWWIAGAVVAATCAAGQWLTSYLLPTPGTWVPAARRLDAYLVAGPALVLTMWILGA